MSSLLSDICSVTRFLRHFSRFLLIFFAICDTINISNVCSKTHTERHKNMTYILFNPLANNSQGKATAARLKQEKLPHAELIDLIGLDVCGFLDTLAADDEVIICGGDGTLSRFADDVHGKELPCTVRLFGAGTGNDFLKDIGGTAGGDSMKVNDYLNGLPTVRVNDIERKFVNGIGYGIDGMACEVADDKKLRGETDINYTKISIGLCLGGYKCPNAKVTVDGRVMQFRRVWLASAMKGRYYGGGMMVAPDQDRKSDVMSCVVLHDSGRLHTLAVFPGIFSGSHVKHKKIVTVLTGKNITVEFDKPCALQIDGDTVRGVRKYNAVMPE